MTVAHRFGSPGSLRAWLWTRPQWWSLLVAAAAWVSMAPHWLHADHAGHGVAAARELQGWLLMVLAMMVPLMGEQLKAIAFRNFANRRHASMAVYLGGYLAPWALVGVLVAGLRTQPLGQHPLAPAIAFGAAALWVLSPAWTWAHRVCHGWRTTGAAGWSWLRDTSRLGARHGCGCVGTCWPVMLGCALSGHALYAMLGGLLLGLFERSSYWLPRRRLAIGCLLLAAWAMSTR